MKTITPYIVIFIIGIAAGMCLCRSFFSKEETTIVEQKDTLVIYDTIRIEKPAEIRYEVLTERILVHVRDTIWEHDTLFLSLPTQRKAYKDDDYYAEVSGYNPSLDYIEVYPRTTTITKTEKIRDPYKNSISFGVEAEFISEVSIPIYLEYERMLHKNASFFARALYVLPSNRYGVAVGCKAQIGW